MKADNPFDSGIRLRKVPPNIHQPASHVVLNLELAWDAARAIFEDKATPEHAIAICKIFMEAAGDIGVAREPRGE